MSTYINYGGIQPLKVNPSYKEQTCILNKNQECAIRHVKNCKKTLKKTCYCLQKCLCNKIDNRKFCNKVILQNVIFNKMSKESRLFYEKFFLPRFLKTPQLSRFNYPNREKLGFYLYLDRYIQWLAHNRQFYSLWLRMFASQNSPAVYDMGASMVFGNS